MPFVGRAAAWLLIALSWSVPLAAQQASAEDAIRTELREFYRDYRANHWPDVLDHFWVGKITARWTAPTADSAWIGARPIPGDSACALEQHGKLALSIVVIADRWARVFAAGRTCTAPPDELWMLRVGEAWRIARMVPGIDGVRSDRGAAESRDSALPLKRPHARLRADAEPRVSLAVYR